MYHFLWKLSHELFHVDRRKENVKPAQLWMKCSKRNAHLFALYVAYPPTCLCGHNIKDSVHYLLHWPTYFVSRQHMWHNLLSFVDVHVVNVYIVLYGIENGNFMMHSEIFEAIHQLYKLAANYNHHFQTHWVTNDAYWPMNLYFASVCFTTRVNVWVNDNCCPFLYHCNRMFGEGNITLYWL